MNKEDIIRMAQEAGFDYSGAELSWESVICTEELERFAALVISAECERLTNVAIKAAEKSVDVAIALEREACAKIVLNEAYQYTSPVWAFEIVNDIRERGQA